MPFRYIKDGPGLILVCVNYGVATIPHEPEPGEVTTMRRAEEWNALTLAYPPGHLPFGVHIPGPPRPVFSGVGGIPVRCFVCRVCGYIEMYAGPIIEPATWPGADMKVV